MSTHILENERLRVTIADAGAELISVYDMARQAERIWTGDKAVWNRHAPILFPFVGKVMDGKYRVGEKEYPMRTQHGFARDMDFKCLETSEFHVHHRLEADAETLSVYPWPFALNVRHILTGNKLDIMWVVENNGDRPMFFSIGGHPGFMLPEGVKKEDCDILFPGMETLNYISASPAGYALPEQKKLTLKDGRARYQDDIPDTWIFEDGQVKKVGIATPDGEPWVMLSCGLFPMLAVWANPKGPFICLEPWFGRTDDDGFTGTIDQKKGIQMLGAGEKLPISYSIEFC